jgi:hypothetical protein
MMTFRGLLLFSLAFLYFDGIGQDYLQLRTGSFEVIPVTVSKREDQPIHYLFYKSPQPVSAAQRDSFIQQGLNIIYALPGNIYWVKADNALIRKSPDDFFTIDPVYKIGTQRDTRESMHHLRLSLPPDMSMDVINNWVSQYQVVLIDTRALPFGLMDVIIPSQYWEALVNTPWITFIESIPEDEEVNYRLTNAERGWGLKSPLTRNLDGSGMTIGVGDGGRLGIHEDLAADVLDLASFSLSDHATMVTGIVAGSGLIDPAFGFGYAPAAKVLVRNFSDIIWDAPQYVEDFGLSLTNNSYSSQPFDCDYIGDYNGTSTAIDAMMDTYDQLLHVFAAGNSGTITCAPFPIRYATIAGGYQSAKNVLTVGAISITDANVIFSSRGPVDDGRLKPEVVAYGQNRFSTTNNHNYNTNSGTSFSSPATMGLATLLYQRYRQMHNDSLPDAALIKNLICNASDDLGTAGPDFIYGFGRINGVRAVEILEENRFDSLHVHHNSSITRTIDIPAGAASADIMLMWNDVAAAPYSTVALVNDLDLLVIDPSGDTLKPWQLNYTPAGVATAATMGEDHTNNYEQVTIQQAEEGTYTIVISGYHILMGPQTAWLSWDIHMAGIIVQSPLGGEVFRPGNPNVGNDQQYIRFDAFGTGSSTFNASYSTNGGNSWNAIAGIIPADKRYHNWYIPNIATDQFRIKITASNGMEDTSDDDAVVLAPPANLVVTSPCEGYLQASWNAVAGADHYRVFMIRNETLISLDTTSSTSFTIGGFGSNETIRMTVAGEFDSGATGLRARAVSGTPNGSLQCTWTDDLRLSSIIQPVTGREATSSALTASETIEVLLSNAGTQDASGFSLSYQLDDLPVVTEAFAGTLNAGTSQVFSFTQTADMSALQTFDIKVWVSYNQDPYSENDTLFTTISHLPNPAIVLPWNENFENAIDTTFLNSTSGMAELDAWDAMLGNNCRVRTFAGSPFAHEGQRALTADAVRNISPQSGHMMLTLNLENYNVQDHDIRMSIHVMHHEIIPDGNAAESIQVRGSDTEGFITLMTLSDDPLTRGKWQALSGLEISEALADAGQDFSSSFQLKFPFEVYATAGEIESQDGQTIDDLSLVVINRDLRLNEILYPSSVSCGLGSEQIIVSVSNTTDEEVPNARVSYQVNDGTIFLTSIGSVPADTTIIYTLSQPFDFSNPGAYHLRTWITTTQDDFKANDTMELDVLHSPLIDDYPYMEGFETGPGNWFTNGVNNSWAHGASGKSIISHAAEGEMIWTTSLSGTYNADEISYLYSPCFDLNSLNSPFLSFALKYNLEANYDYAWVEYRLEGNSEWTKLGIQGSGTNWYNHINNAWNGNQSKWITSAILIPVTDTIIQFRWVFQSDVGVELEGIAIDQVHVYDNTPIYTGAGMQWTLPVSGNEWVHFDQNNQRVFSIHPQGQNLGNVTLTLFKSNQNFLTGDSLYLLSRNWVLTSTNPVNDEILLRGYFLTAEANHLVNATGCNLCINARDAFDIAALRYSGELEDGSFTNNDPEGITCYHRDSTQIFPYENGYCAEWKTDELSEWWISTTVSKVKDVFIRRIAGSADDAEEHEANGSVNPYRDSLALTDFNGEQRIGLRFTNITIPHGSYISGATLTFTSSDSSSGMADWILQSQMINDAPAFGTLKYNISLRSRSDQVVTWSPGSWNANEEYGSPDIRHLIQRVIDQPGWMNGNDIVLLIKGSGLRNAWSYDGDPDLGAVLTISYEPGCDDGGIVYVDANATGQQNGNSWMNAYRHLEQAIDRISHCPGITQIWMADGLYAPYEEVARTQYFLLPAGVSIYGGFQGGETTIEDRIYGAFPTIISGNIGNINLQTDNLYHVLTTQPGPQTLLDGLTIRDGMANGVMADQQTGAGIYNNGVLKCHGVILEENSTPAVYNAPGSQFISIGSVEIRE